MSPTSLVGALSSRLDVEASIHPAVLLLWGAIGLAGLLVGVVAVRLARRRALGEASRPAAVVTVAGVDAEPLVHRQPIVA